MLNRSRQAIKPTTEGAQVHGLSPTYPHKLELFLQKEGELLQNGVLYSQPRKSVIDCIESYSEVEQGFRNPIPVLSDII